MTDNADNHLDLKTSLYNLSDELGQLVLREHQILQVEMRQVGTLVGDAVKKLDSNFRYLSASATEQSKILSKVLDDGCVDEEQRNRFVEISEQINARAATTIRVLQFDDIVQQLAGHTCDRIARMQELFNEIEFMLQKIKSLDSFEYYEVARHINKMQNEVGRFRVRLEKENPVKQSSMEEGKIELF